MRFLASTVSAFLLPCVAVSQWPLDPEGWTVMQPSPGVTTTIYVSNSLGDDINFDGLHPYPISATQGPKQTIRAGYDLLRDGYPDWLLLKAGDTFTSPQDAMDASYPWTKSGISTTEPMIFGSYWSENEPPPRPRIVCNDQALRIYTAVGVKNLLVTGIHFECPNPANPAVMFARGIYMIGGGPNIPNKSVRIEDCYINGWWQGIAVDPWPSKFDSDISIRRCVVVDNFRVDSSVSPPGPVPNSGGLYVEQTNGLLVEECVFDRNGWDGVNVSTRSIYNHNNYIQDDCTDVTIRGNISARGSADNYQVRPIGTIHNNLSLKAPIHFHMGHDLDPMQPDPPRWADIKGNVALEGDDIGPGSGLRGWAYFVQNVEVANSSMRYNIASNKGTAGGNPVSIELDGSTQTGIQNLSVHHNVVSNWGAPLTVNGVNMPNVVLHSNDIQDTNTISQLSPSRVRTRRP